MQKKHRRNLSIFNQINLLIICIMTLCSNATCGSKNNYMIPAFALPDKEVEYTPPSSQDKVVSQICVIKKLPTELCVDIFNLLSDTAQPELLPITLVNKYWNSIPQVLKIKKRMNDKENLNKLEAMLTHRPFINTLILHHCNIGVTEAQQIISIIKKSPHLKKIDFSHNQITLNTLRKIITEADLQQTLHVTCVCLSYDEEKMKRYTCHY